MEDHQIHLGSLEETWRMEDHRIHLGTQEETWGMEDHRIQLQVEVDHLMSYFLGAIKTDPHHLTKVLGNNSKISIKEILNLI